MEQRIPVRAAERPTAGEAVSELRHPVQTTADIYKGSATVPACVTLRAYEVYRKLFGPQEALITGGCRGGFGVEELASFLYARTFPESEWRQRFDEALRWQHERRR